MTESIKQPRWIPAAEKPGGLVFGDSVRYTLEYDPNGEYQMVVTDANYNRGVDKRQIAVRVAHEDSPLGPGEVLRLEDLLVRIDPPAQLPESTDAFRQGVVAGFDEALSGIEFYRDQIECYDQRLAVNSVLCAVGHEKAKAIEKLITTPTEAADGE